MWTKTKIQKHLKLRRNMHAIRKQSYPLLHLQIYLLFEATSMYLVNSRKSQETEFPECTKVEPKNKKIHRYSKKVFIKNILMHPNTLPQTSQINLTTNIPMDFPTDSQRTHEWNSNRLTCLKPNTYLKELGLWYPASVKVKWMF